MAPRRRSSLASTRSKGRNLRRANSSGDGLRTKSLPSLGSASSRPLTPPGPPFASICGSLRFTRTRGRGKLVVGWPPPERSWYRRAHNNLMPILAIREENYFSADPPPWHEIDFTWAELGILPQRMRAALEQWRGVYLIWDSLDAKSYVGSAYGASNILGRWENYAATGHGGNKHLRGRNPANFRFTVIELVAPNTASELVIALESSWKRRLHTAAPNGLNEN